MKKMPLYFIPFTVSGMLGLIFQVVWSRFFNAVFGSTIYSVSVVIASFMFGVTAGSFWISRKLERVKNPLRTYGTVVAVIGMSVLAFYPAFEFIGKNLHVLYRLAFRINALFLFYKFLIAFLMLIVPTFFMGTTYPLLVRAWKNETGDLAGIPYLYAANTLGGAAGALLAGFVLIRHLGLKDTLFSAAAAAVLTGLIVWKLAPATTHAPVSAGEKAPAGSGPGLPALIFVTGFVSFIFEVALNRVLAPVFGTTVYSFSIILTAYLTGIFAGSLIFEKYKNGKGLLAACLITLSMYFILSTYLFQFLPSFMMGIKNALLPTAGTFFAIEFIVVFGIILIPSVCFGITFPLIIRAGVVRAGESASGYLYGVNSIGAVSGSLLTSLLFIPALGLRATLLLIPLIISVLIFFLVKERTGKVLAGVLCVLVIAGPKWDPKMVVTNVIKENAVYDRSKYDILFFKDSIYQNVSVLKYRDKDQLSLKLDGKADASYGDEEAQKAAGVIPAFFHPLPRNALVVGLGSGSTSSALLAFPFIERVDSVEIEPAVIEAAKYFEKINKGVFNDSRSEVICNDARTFLLLNPENRYDIITSEPSNPWLSGVSLLFTKEYFELVSAHLNPGGIFCQWFPIYQVDLATVKTVLKTVNSVFPHISFWWLSGTDMFILASASPIKNDYLNIEERLALVKDMAREGNFKYFNNFKNVEEFFYLKTGDARSLNKYLLDTHSLNVNDRPIIEFNAPKHVFSDHSVAIVKDIILNNPQMTVNFTNCIRVDDSGFNILPASLLFKGDYMKFRFCEMVLDKHFPEGIEYLSDTMRDVKYYIDFATRESEYRVMALRRIFENRQIFADNLSALVPGLKDALAEVPENFSECSFIINSENVIVKYSEAGSFLWIIKKSTEIRKSDADSFAGIVK